MYSMEWWWQEWNHKREQLSQGSLAWLRTKEGTVPVIIEHKLKNGRYSVWLSNNRVKICDPKDLIVVTD